MVTVKLTGTYGYGNPRRFYGPGDAVQVPEGLATALGLTPIQTEETQAKNPVSLPKTTRKRKAS